MALTTQAEVEKRLQWDITGEPDPVITSLIAAATGLIEGEIGREVESDDYTESYDADMNPILLDHWPVTAIATVTEDGTATTDYVFYDDGRLFRTSNGHISRWRTRKLKSISVAYTGGYLVGTHDSELAHIGSIATEVVARAFRSGAASATAPAGVGLGGIASVSLAGSDSVTYSAVGGETFELGGGLSRFIQLLDDERRQLTQYRDLV